MRRHRRRDASNVPYGEAVHSFAVRMRTHAADACRKDNPFPPDRFSRFHFFRCRPEISSLFSKISRKISVHRQFFQPVFRKTAAIFCCFPVFPVFCTNPFKPIKGTFFNSLTAASRRSRSLDTARKGLRKGAGIPVLSATYLRSIILSLIFGCYSLIIYYLYAQF